MRSTATSVVGVVLSLGAVAVLVVWWFRTSRKRRAAPPEGRRGRGHDGRTTGAPVTDRRGRIDGLPADAGWRTASTGRGHAGHGHGHHVVRLTGVGRVIALTLALGGGGFADAYNLANTTPNIVHDIVLGGVLSATFVPVFVDHLTTRRGKEAWEAISAVVTVTVTVLVAATVVFFVLTPDHHRRLYTVTNHSADVHQQQADGHLPAAMVRPPADLLRPHRRVHRPAQRPGQVRARPCSSPSPTTWWSSGSCSWFHALVPHPSLASVDAHRTGLVLLGIGTTLGVVVQAALLLPSLLRADLHLRFLWNPAHEAMRTITRLAGWTFGWVVANQVALVVVLALADGTKVPGARVGVHLRLHLLPTSLRRGGRVGDERGDARRFRPGGPGGTSPLSATAWPTGLRAMLAIIIPSAVGMLILAHPLIDLVLAHGAETSAKAESTASGPGHVRPGAPGLLHLPLHGAGPPVHAGHSHRVPPLPGGERRQHRLARGPGRPPRGTRLGPVAFHRLHVGRSVGPGR